MDARTLFHTIDHVGIRVHDLARARRFYELIGFEFVAGPLGPEPVAIMTHASGFAINLIINADEPEADNVLMDVGAKHPGYTHMALSVSDMDAVEAYLVDQGIALSGSMTFPNGGRAIFVRDPDRNVVEFNAQPGKERG